MCRASAEKFACCRHEQQLQRICSGVIAGLPPEQLCYDFNGLVFGERRQDAAWEPRFHACLLARELHAARILVADYNPSKRRDAGRFWKQFSLSGKLPPVRVTTEAQAGAVSVFMTVSPEESQRFDFALAWHVPEALGEKWGFGNVYGRSFKSAQDSANHALKHLGYMVSAVEKWQKRLTEPKLPADFGNVIIHSTRALTTHTRQTPKGGFVLAQAITIRLRREAVGFPFLDSDSGSPHFHTLAIGTRIETQAAVRDKRLPDSVEVYCEIAEWYYRSTRTSSSWVIVHAWRNGSRPCMPS